MADDFRISEMQELLAGGFHDNLLFEVVDLTEGDVADQNKKVKWVTIQTVIDPSRIAAGNSWLQVLDPGNGQFVGFIDALQILDWSLITGIRFGAIFAGSQQDFMLDFANGEFYVRPGAVKLLELTDFTATLGDPANTWINLDWTAGPGLGQTIFGNGVPWLTADNQSINMVVDQSGGGPPAIFTMISGALINLNSINAISGGSQVSADGGSLEAFLQAEDGGGNAVNIKATTTAGLIEVNGTDLLDIGAAFQIMGDQTAESISVDQAGDTIAAFIANTPFLLINALEAVLGDFGGVTKVIADWTNSEIEAYASDGLNTGTAILAINNYYVDFDGTKWLDIAPGDQILGLDANESWHIDQAANTITAYVAGTPQMVITATAVQLPTARIETNTGTPIDLTLDCGTEKTLVLAQPVYEDANLGGAVLHPIPAQAPDTVEFVDEAAANTGIYTFGYAVGEAASGNIEIPHAYKEGTDLSFHVHFNIIAAPTGTDNVQWQLTYTISRNGETLDAPRVINTADIPVDTQYEAYLAVFPSISGTTGGVNGGGIQIGDQFLFTLERVAATGDAFAGDALVETAGIHHQVDTMGSRQIATK